MVQHAVHEPKVQADGFSVEDWLAWDRAGDLRVELIDGALVVNPAPVPRHNRVVQRLLRLLEDVVLSAGLTADITASGVVSPGMQPEQGLIPDILIARADLDIDDLLVVEAADVTLVVEVLSPSSRRKDRMTKLDIYASMGIPYYWIVDPRSPVTITTLVLDEGAYRQGASASGDEELTISEPFAVSLTPKQLVEKRTHPQG